MLESLYFELNGKYYLKSSEQFRAGMEYAQYLISLPEKDRDMELESLERALLETRRRKEAASIKDQRPELLRELTKPNLKLIKND